MSEIPVAQSGWRWLPLGLALLGLDQLTKWLVARSVALYEMITLLPVLDITHAHNVGAAFNFLARAGGWQRWFFTALALGVGGGIIYYLRQLSRAQSLQCAGLSLIAAGAVGNMIDRLRLGYVVDFIHVHWGSAEFPSFNVADSCITIGAGLMILDTLLEARRNRTTS
ncbi:MAG: signal peptidase II [Pseudomonadota bacterium]